MLKQCEFCGKQFNAARSSKRFCDSSCRARFAAAPKAPKPRGLFWPDLYYGMCPDGSDAVTIEGVIASAIAQSIDDDVVPAGLVEAAKAKALEFAEIEAARHT
ncbi:hypothetical protein ACFRFH_09545 [Leifsonia sp. NPDC056824]|uniref:hypothetical protein n=1 Tax=Leifsonia sp. NPDC056824 TaxID=3345953 RepID=UPI0036C34C5C